MTDFERFVEAVERATGRAGKRVGREVRLLCPAHDDHNPSLDVAEGTGGVPLATCRSNGCSWESICEAIGWQQGQGGSRDVDVWTPHGDAEAVYDYVDEQGQLLFQVCRTLGKKFIQRRPDPTTKTGWRYRLDRVRRVLYRLPEVLAAVQSGGVVYVCEGEKDADAVRAAGAVATCNPGGAGKWKDEYTASLRGVSEVVVVADDDEPGRKHASGVMAKLQAAGVSARVVLPAVGKDASDHLAAGRSLAELRPLGGAAPVDEVLSNAPPVDGAWLLDALVEVFARYVVLAEEARIALALWVVHTHAIAAADITPYISVTSAEKRSGKSRLLWLLSYLVRDHWLTFRVSASVLARKIDAVQPTLLLDEADTMFGNRGELGDTLRGILNSGFQRGGTSSLNVPVGRSSWQPIDLSTFCAKAIAGIGLLPDTVMDRSIRIEMLRKVEPVDRLRARQIREICQPLNHAAATWAAQNVALLTGAEPELPEELDDRAQDIWEPLIAIADRAGGDWPETSRAAAVALARHREDDGLSVRVQLLRDIRRVFDANEGADRLTSSTVILELAQYDDGPWGDWYGKTIAPQAISKLLQPFGIKTREIWSEGHKHRGWMRAQFEDAWERYLPTPVDAVEPVDAASGTEARSTRPTAPTGPPACMHEAHRGSEWRNDAGRLICGICHPQPDRKA